MYCKYWKFPLQRPHNNTEFQQKYKNENSDTMRRANESQLFNVLGMKPSVTSLPSLVRS